jgi:hypothetical protein
MSDVPGAGSRSRSARFSPGVGAQILSAPLRLVGAPLRLAAAIVGEGVRTERVLRTALARAARALALDTLDALLAAAFADETVGVAYTQVRASGVGERVLERLIADGIPERLAARVLESPEFGRMLDRALESEQTQLALARALESQAAERLLERLAASPASERLVAQALASPLVEGLVTGLLESEQLWVLVDEIARSPSVTEAISHQGRGFVDEVAERARDRSRHADAWLQRIARGRRRQGVNGREPERRILPPGGTS